MAHPLDGVWEKLARADKHLQDMKDALQLVPQSDTDLIPGEFDTYTGRYIFRAQRDGVSPMWLGPLIGDFVHNTKAALDYLIWELVAINGEPQAHPWSSRSSWTLGDTESSRGARFAASPTKRRQSLRDCSRSTDQIAIRSTPTGMTPPRSP